MYIGWTETDCQDRHRNTDQKEDGTWDDRRRDGGTNSTLRTKEKGTRLTLPEHDDDDVDIFLWTRVSEGFRNTVVVFCVPFEMRGESKTSHFHYKRRERTTI